MKSQNKNYEFKNLFHMPSKIAYLLQLLYEHMLCSIIFIVYSFVSNSIVLGIASLQGFLPLDFKIQNF